MSSFLSNVYIILTW